jgi:hypothetical protein
MDHVKDRQRQREQDRQYMQRHDDEKAAADTGANPMGVRQKDHQHKDKYNKQDEIHRRPKARDAEKYLGGAFHKI